MTDTVYIPVSISTPPEMDGWYYVMNPNKEILPRMIEYKVGEWQNYNELNISWWLRPIPLSQLLGEAFEAGAEWGEQPLRFSEIPDKESYINSIINPQK